MRQSVKFHLHKKVHLGNLQIVLLLGTPENEFRMSRPSEYQVRFVFVVRSDPSSAVDDE